MRKEDDARNGWPGSSGITQSVDGEHDVYLMRNVSGEGGTTCADSGG
jgi:hypothetical protein